MPARLQWPLVLVRWVDSSSPRMGWQRLSEWKDAGSLECVSVGYIIAEDERSKTIAPHLAYLDDPEQCQGNGIITIPCGAIVSVEPLVTDASACEASGRSVDRPESAPPCA